MSRAVSLNVDTSAHSIKKGSGTLGGPETVHLQVHCWFPLIERFEKWVKADYVERAIRKSVLPRLHVTDLVPSFEAVYYSESGGVRTRYRALTNSYHRPVALVDGNVLLRHVFAQCGI